jgi:hypothetical protein
MHLLLILQEIVTSGTSLEHHIFQVTKKNRKEDEFLYLQENLCDKLGTVASKHHHILQATPPNIVTYYKQHHQSSHTTSTTTKHHHVLQATPPNKA